MPDLARIVKAYDIRGVVPDVLDESLARDLGGAVRSAAGNKMNELGPHGLWAEQVLRRAAAYGVLARPSSVVELLQRGRTVADAVYPTRSDVSTASR